MLDARLYHGNASVRHRCHLLPRGIGLDLVEEVDADFLLFGPRDEALVVIRRQNIVCHEQVTYSVPIDDALELRLKSLRSLLSIRHAVGVEATEGAVVLGTPPAPP